MRLCVLSSDSPRDGKGDAASQALSSASTDLTSPMSSPPSTSGGAQRPVPKASPPAVSMSVDTPELGCLKCGSFDHVATNKNCPRPRKAALAAPAPAPALSPAKKRSRETSALKDVESLDSTKGIKKAKMGEDTRYWYYASEDTDESTKGKRAQEEKGKGVSIMPQDNDGERKDTAALREKTDPNSGASGTISKRSAIQKGKSVNSSKVAKAGSPAKSRTTKPKSDACSSKRSQEPESVSRGSSQDSQRTVEAVDEPPKVPQQTNFIAQGASDDDQDELETIIDDEHYEPDLVDMVSEEISSSNSYQGRLTGLMTNPTSPLVLLGNGRASAAIHSSLTAVPHERFSAAKFSIRDNAYSHVMQAIMHRDRCQQNETAEQTSLAEQASSSCAHPRTRGGSGCIERRGHFFPRTEKNPALEDHAQDLLMSTPLPDYSEEFVRYMDDPENDPFSELNLSKLRFNYLGSRNYASGGGRVLYGRRLQGWRESRSVGTGLDTPSPSYYHYLA